MSQVLRPMSPLGVPSDTRLADSTYQVNHVSMPEFETKLQHLQNTTEKMRCPLSYHSI